MLTIEARRAEADDAVVRAEMARTHLEQAMDRLLGHRAELERARTKARARRSAQTVAVNVEAAP